jgi:hypothetical protein
LQLKHIPGFQIKQPMIEDIRNDTVAWSFLNLLSNHISLPGLFLTPRTRNNLSSHSYQTPFRGQVSIPWPTPMHPTATSSWTPQCQERNPIC